MPLVDVILILIIGGFVIFGFVFGLVHTLGSLVGTVLGIILASRFVGPAADAFGWMFGGGGFARVILFIILFILISRGIGILFWLAEKVFDTLAWIPFARPLGRLLGATFGFIEGVLFVAAVIFFAMQYLPQDAVRFALQESAVAKLLLALAAAIQVLFPESVRLGK